MVTVVIALVCVALVPLFGLAIGLGSDRFWWIVERATLGLVALFVGGIVIGEKLKGKENNVDGN